MMEAERHSDGIRNLGVNLRIKPLLHHSNIIEHCDQLKRHDETMKRVHDCEYINIVSPSITKPLVEQRLTI